MNTNLRKKALFPIIAMVLVSVITLSSVTYAWFTMSDEARVNNLQVNVAGADGIQISLDAKTWKSSIDSSELTTDAAYTGNTNQVPSAQAAIAPVSTAGVVDANGFMEMFKGTLNPDNTLDAVKCTDTAGTEGDYIAFDLFFKMNEAKTISLEIGDQASHVKASNTDTDAEYSARVAFINLGGTTEGSSVATGLDVASETYIWEPNANQHLDSVTATGKVDYYGVNAAVEDVKTGNGLSSEYVETSDPTATDEILHLVEGINKVRVYIWMEGQDVDCINDASGGSFITNLKFTQPSEDTNA